MRPVIRLDAKPIGFATPAEGLKVAPNGSGSGVLRTSALGGRADIKDAVSDFRV